ncbi:secreted protein [Candidatus Magnetobacterium bavaricum]|uniref:Secreted protein n=1 Tax=Candidatus Magnetobacterium bavaricum TaxID=29290 RepID=A0A0F3GX19_9BACT|nr:secreted protein [Candidatus Magnetobacterium bavaricum]
MCIVLLAVVTLSCIANAEMYVLLDKRTTPGVGSTYRTNDEPTWTCDVSLSDNTTTSVSVRIEGSLGGVFSPTGMADYTLSPAEMASYKGSFSISGIPVRFIRANLVTLTGGSSPAVTVNCLGVK